MKNKIITPEVIFQKLSDRLGSKSEEVDYLIHTYKKFEKWLQCELVLSLREDVILKAYDNSFNEIKDENGEIIEDLSIEYQINDELTRCDFCIAESPFLINYADEETWQISADSIDKCRRYSKDTKYHYVELKLLNDWVYPDSLINTVCGSIIEDFEKYFKNDWSKFLKEYRPASIISICCIKFNESKEGGQHKIIEDIERFGDKITDEIMKKIKLNKISLIENFIWQKIGEDLYLLSVYFTV